MANLGLDVYINIAGNYLRAGTMFVSMMNRIRTMSRSMQQELNGAMMGLTASAAAAATQLFILNRLMRRFVRITTDAELGLARVTTMFNTTGFNVQKLNYDMMNLSARFGETLAITQAAEYQALSSGIVEVGDSMKFMDAASRLAIGGVTDMKTAIDGLTSIMGAYNLEAQEMTDITDAMFLATKKGKTTIQEISQSIGRVAPVAAQMGINPDELLAAISTLTTSGLSTRHSVTRLNAILIALTKAERNRVVQQEASRLGIEFSSKALREKGIVKFFRDIRNSANYTSASFEKLFQTSEAIVGANALMVENGKRFERILGLMAHKAGETEEAFRKIYNTMSRQIKIFKASTIVIILKSFYPLLDLFKTILVAANKLIRAINDILDVAPYIGTFTIVAAGFTMLVGSVLALGVALKDAYKILDLFVKAEKELLDITIIKTMYAPLNYIAELYASIGELIVMTGISQKEAIMQAVNLLVEDLGAALIRIKNSIKSIMLFAWDNVKRLYTFLNDKLKNDVPKLFLDTLSTLKSFSKTALKTLNSLYTAIFINTEATLTGLFTAIQTFLTSVFTSTTFTIAGITTAIGAALESLWVFAVENPLAVILITLAAIGAALIAIKVIFDKLYESNFMGMKDFFEAIKEKVILLQKGVEALVETFDGAFSHISTKLEKQLKEAGLYELAKGIASMINSIKALLTGVIEGLKVALAPFAAIMVSLFKFTFKVINFINNALNFIGDKLHLNLNLVRTIGQAIGITLGAITFPLQILIALLTALGAILSVITAVVIGPILMGIKILIKAIKILLHAIAFPFEVLSLIFQTIILTIKKSFAPLMKDFAEIWSSWKKILGNIWEGISNLFGKGKSMTDILVFGLKFLSKTLANIIKIVLILLRPLIEYIKFMVNLILKASEGFKNITKNTKNVFGIAAIPGKIIFGIFTFILGLWKNLLFTVLDFIANYFTFLKPFVKFIKDAIQILFDYYKKGVNVITNLSQNIADVLFAESKRMMLDLGNYLIAPFNPLIDLMKPLVKALGGMVEESKRLNDSLTESFGLTGPELTPASVYTTPTTNIYPQLTDEQGNPLPSPTNITVANTPMITPSTSIIPNVMPNINIKTDEDLIKHQKQIVDVLENIEKLMRQNRSFRTEDLIER